MLIERVLPFVEMTAWCSPYAFWTCALTFTASPQPQHPTPISLSHLPADDGAVDAADRREGAVQLVLRKWVLRRQRLIDIDTEAGLVVAPEHAVPHLGRTREHFPRCLVEQMELLYAEVGARDIEVQV